jgi:hypothetical protein
MVVHGDANGGSKLIWDANINMSVDKTADIAK